MAGFVAGASDATRIEAINLTRSQLMTPGDDYNQFSFVVSEAAQPPRVVAASPGWLNISVSHSFSFLSYGRMGLCGSY